MNIITRAPEDSCNIDDWRAWLDELHTDPLFIDQANHPSVVDAVKHAHWKINYLETIARQQRESDH
jgi:hypothetical protein